MTGASSWYPDTPEPLIVDLARGGDRGAFEELVRRRQGEVRGLMRHLSNDAALADDLAQQVFLQAWLRLRTLRKVVAFSGWLKRIAVKSHGGADLPGMTRAILEAGREARRQVPRKIEASIHNYKLEMSA